jgi:probable rRNA maturation factor
LRIRIFYDRTNFRLKGWRKIRKLVDKVISDEGKVPGDLNFILTNDSSIRKINRQFLQHNYYTDVISFDNSKDNVVSGEVYISLDTVKINALNYKVSLRLELIRVIIHGILHLCGYDDKSETERGLMRTREDYWLNVLRSI